MRLDPISRIKPDESKPCLAIQLYKATSIHDHPRWGGKSQLRLGIWTCHLIDFVLTGVLDVDVKSEVVTDVDDNAIRLHPLVQEAWCHLRAGLPPVMKGCFDVDVAPIRRATDAVIDWVKQFGESKNTASEDQGNFKASILDRDRKLRHRALAAILAGRDMDVRGGLQSHEDDFSDTQYSTQVDIVLWSSYLARYPSFLTALCGPWEL
jgi:hypothetical protein